MSSVPTLFNTALGVLGREVKEGNEGREGRRDEGMKEERESSGLEHIK